MIGPRFDPKVLIVVAAALLMARGTTELPACIPQPAIPSGWGAMPYAVSMNDSVVGWYPNEAAASREAIQLAYRNPTETVQVASVVRMEWRKTDGTPCTPEDGT